MSLEKLIYIVDGYLLYPNKCNKINDYKIDSRLINKNDCFIAIKGNTYDGFNYIEESIKKGCSVLILDRIPNTNYNIPIIIVNSTYDALLKIGLFKRNKYKIPLIAVTGSVGKTSTKELIYSILSKKYKVLKSVDNQNNHLGIPLTLLKLNKSYDIIVLEMGMNHLGEINTLSKYSNPDVAVITNIGSAHIGNLGNINQILKAKLEIINNMKNGLFIINGNDKILKKVKSDNINIIKCGFNKNDDLYAYEINSNIYSSTFKIKFNNNEYIFKSNTPGIEFITNILIAVYIGLYYKVDIFSIIDAVNEYKPLKKRLNITKFNNTILIDDCYNSSYESLKMVLDLIKNEKKIKIIILGDILELGSYSKKIHKQIKKEVKKIKNCHVFTVGQNMKKVGLNFNSTKELNDYLELIDLNNKIFLIKGSRKIHLECVKEKIEKMLI